MLGVPGLLSSSGDVSVPVGAHEGGDVGAVGSNSGGFSEEDRSRGEEGDRNSGGNRWPRQETLALLKIRSDMDVAFRDSSLKGPLWEEVSRKLAQLGFHRNAKKCKEKFENVFKYHKRTREGRAAKPDGKTYRFFDQLEALENHPSSLPLVPTPKPQTSVAAAPMPATTNPPTVSQVSTVPSTTTPIASTNLFQNTVTAPTINPTNPSPSVPVPVPVPVPAPPSTIPSSLPNMSTMNLISNSTSSSTSSDEEPERRRKRKRKWKGFFERLMMEVINKQEELQKKFIEAIEKREHDRMVREEGWKMQEMARMNREHEVLVQERSIAAAKDAAVIAFLQKVSEQQNPVQVQVQVQDSSNTAPPPPPQPLPLPLQSPPLAKHLDINPTKTNNGGDNYPPPSSSRWPKTEVQALIRLRTSLDLKYHESGPKGPLWEEISAAMRKLGYNRNAKRCKEKWENINKYFKKVKESNKKRPEDAKTCPYFHQLDALYKEKNKIDNSLMNSPSYGGMKTDNNPMVPLMVRPEQQWPLEQEHRGESVMEDLESENMDQNHQEEEDDEEEEEDQEDGDGDGDGDDEEEDEGGGGYEIVTNKPSSMGKVE